MRVRARDVVATLFVVAEIAVYGLWTSGAALGGLGVRGVAGLMLVLGFGACVSAPREVGPGSALYNALTAVIGVGAVVGAIWALVAQSEAMLLVLAVASAALWLLATVRHVTRPAPSPAT